jgi:hypothetical protein
MTTAPQDALHDARALHEIQALARFNRIAITLHASERMNQRGATKPDIRRALLTATVARRQADHDSWRVEGGVDLDDEELTLVCDYGADVVVVTLF